MIPFLAGLIVAHAAMPAVLAAYPERVQDGVDGYIALSDCSEIGNQYILVRTGVRDMLVAVADCARLDDRQYRADMNYIADVEAPGLWRGGMWPQRAELWRVEDRAAWLARWEKATA